tara:strand:- start:4114 stop:7098 length:2985 start_codon:yes stop_codon:yes gene_type:complete
MNLPQKTSESSIVLELRNAGVGDLLSQVSYFFLFCEGIGLQPKFYMPAGQNRNVCSNRELFELFGFYQAGYIVESAPGAEAVPFSLALTTVASGGVVEGSYYQFDNASYNHPELKRMTVAYKAPPRCLVEVFRCSDLYQRVRIRRSAAERYSAVVHVRRGDVAQVKLRTLLPLLSDQVDSNQIAHVSGVYSPRELERYVSADNIHRFKQVEDYKQVLLDELKSLKVQTSICLLSDGYTLLARILKHRDAALFRRDVSEQELKDALNAELLPLARMCESSSVGESSEGLIDTLLYGLSADLLVTGSPGLFRRLIELMQLDIKLVTVNKTLMNKDKPVISVVLPTYNDERYIGAAIDSVLAQTFEDFELIIINDGSTDQTASIVDRYAERDARVKVVHRKNEGIVAALNYGLSISKGIYIARMDGDDLSLPKRFALQVRYLQRNLGVVAVGSMFSFIDEDSKLLRLESRSYKIAQSNLYGPRPFGAWMCHPAAMIRKSALIKVGGYRYFRHAEDADLWMRLEEIGQLRNYPEQLFQWRRHAGRVTMENVTEQKQWHALALILARRRREGAREYDLTRPATFEEVSSSLTPYESNRFKIIFSLLRYEHQIYLGGNAASRKEIESFIKGYKDNPSAGLAFLPNHSNIHKVRNYPQRRVTDYIFGREVKDAQVAWYKRLQLQYGVLAKHNQYKEVSVISNREIEQLTQTAVAGIETEFNKPLVTADRPAFNAESYVDGNRWGREAANGVKMLHQTFNILPRMKVLFVECSKNACTTVKKAFGLYEHLEAGYLPKVKADAVHYKASNLFLGSDDLSERSFQGLMGSSQWFKFCICRNPYERLASAYLDKVAGLFSLKGNAKAEYRKVANDIVRLTRGWTDCLEVEIQDQPITFAEFVDYVVQQGSYQHDRHWLSQFITMRPDIVNYDRIVRFEDYNAEMMGVCEGLSLPEYVRETLVQKFNQGRSNTRWKGLYSPRLAVSVYNLYKADFEAFNYSSNSWK